MPDSAKHNLFNPSRHYLMEHCDETRRLEMKTDPEVLRRQARWAGLEPGMRVLDAGCGAGKTSAILRELVGPTGAVVGLDESFERLTHARRTYSGPGLAFLEHDLLQPCPEPGTYDFVWMRFILEYFRRDALTVVRHVADALKPGGILCLIDLDYNCLNHHPLPEKLARTVREVVAILEETQEFDPYAGRKLYTHLYDLGFTEIRVEMEPHHLIYGQLNDVDAFNWYKKLEVAARDCGCSFAQYDGSYEAFAADFAAFFSDPRRFTYTPAILCRGRKP